MIWGTVSSFKKQLTYENLTPQTTSLSTQPTQTPTITLPAIEGISCIPQENERTIARVVRVVDGDTIVANINGIDYKIRYIGMNSPESGASYGLDATNYNKSIVEDKIVILIKDKSETDRYDRLLRFVIVDNTFVNLQMVKAGWSTSGSWPPDTSCDETFYSGEQTAKMNQTGIWNNIAPSTPKLLNITPMSSIEPSQTVEAASPNASSQTCPNGCNYSSNNCEIKGNINSSGEKIFHIPGSGSYEKTVISPEKGELWFCTEGDAIANGWRIPLN